MVQGGIKEVIKNQVISLRNFLEFAYAFAKRNFRAEIIFAPFISGIKDFLALPQKRKMSKYRLDYQMYRLNQMENLIAKNSEHYFLNGQKLNDIR